MSYVAPYLRKNIELVVNTVAKEFGVDVEMLIGRNKTQYVVHARQAAHTLAYEVPGASYPVVAEVVHRHWTTLVKARHVTAARCAKDGYYREMVERAHAHLSAAITGYPRKDLIA